MIALIASNRCPGQRTHCAVDGVGVITTLLERSLNAGDDLVRRRSVVTIDRLVVLIIRVGIVAPGRIPPAVIPAPPTPVEEDECETVVFPPIAIVMMVTMIRVVEARLRCAGDVAVPVAKTRRGLRIEFCFGYGSGGGWRTY